MKGSTNIFLDRSEMSTLCVKQIASVMAIAPPSFTKKSLTLFMSSFCDQDLVNRGGILIELLPEDAPGPPPMFKESSAPSPRICYW